MSGTANVAWTLYQSRCYDEAIRELRSALAVEPDRGDANWILAFVLISKGQPAEAIPILEKMVSQSDRGPGLVGLLATAYARTGRRADALRLITELNHRREKSYIPAEAFVFPFMALGDREQAFASLERSFQEKSTLFQYLKTHPLLDPLRDDPRFNDLLRRVGPTP
jgi:predicted Zn-dependent protease